MNTRPANLYYLNVNNKMAYALFNKQHLNCDDCLEDESKDYGDCFVLCNTLCTIIAYELSQ